MMPAEAMRKVVVSLMSDNHAICLQYRPKDDQVSRDVWVTTEVHSHSMEAGDEFGDHEIRAYGMPIESTEPARVQVREAGGERQQDRMRLDAKYTMMVVTMRGEAGGEEDHFKEITNEQIRERLDSCITHQGSKKILLSRAIPKKVLDIRPISKIIKPKMVELDNSNLDMRSTTSGYWIDNGIGSCTQVRRNARA